MLITIEKVIILKTVSIFSSISDETLAQLAKVMTEVELDTGEQLFAKGDLGDDMFVIINGEVCVHDGDHTLNHLGEKDIFGEMAVLDPEPRVASVTATQPTRMLRLDRQSLYELMDKHSEAAHGIIKVLCGHLRARVADINALKAELNELKTLTTLA